MTGPGARLEVGRVAKAHGLRGEVVVLPITNRPERFAPGAVLYAGDERVVVATSRPSRDAFLVRFEGVADRAGADRLRGTTLTAEPPGPAAEGEVWVHEVIGADCFDRAGRRLGTVEAVEANPAHDLLVLDSGALVPMVFVVAVEPGRVVVDPPEGLLELYEGRA